MSNAGRHGYVEVTETPGVKIPREQLYRLYSRYKFAADFCKDKDVLEVACGAGQGLGYLAKTAKRVVGGDIDENNLKFAREAYSGRPNIELRVLDAQQLPFEDNSFDVVILYEAIYYLNKPEDFIKESLRVLRKNGIIMICTVNKDWADFNPSPYSYKYFSAPELSGMLQGGGFSDIKVYGECPVDDGGAKDKIISFIKRAAVSLHLMPKTMKGKEFLKRIFFGKLMPMPAEVRDGMAEYIAPVPISAALPNKGYKVLFAVGRK